MVRLLLFEETEPLAGSLQGRPSDGLDSRYLFSHLTALSKSPASA